MIEPAGVEVSALRLGTRASLLATTQSENVRREVEDFLAAIRAA